MSAIRGNILDISSQNKQQMKIFKGVLIIRAQADTPRHKLRVCTDVFVWGVLFTTLYCTFVGKYQLFSDYFRKRRSVFSASMSQKIKSSWDNLMHGLVLKDINARHWYGCLLVGDRFILFFFFFLIKHAFSLCIYSM